MYIRSAPEAEQNAANWMLALGYEDAQVTAGGPDGGIDVRSSDGVAQVKWKTAQTGRPDLQRLYGARGDDYDVELLFFTASGYSKGAKEYAAAHEISLFLYDPDGMLTAVNEEAGYIVERANEAERARQLALMAPPPEAVIAEVVESPGPVLLNYEQSALPPQPPQDAVWPTLTPLPQPEQNAKHSKEDDTLGVTVGAISTVGGLMVMGSALAAQPGSQMQTGLLVLGILLVVAGIFLLVLAVLPDS